ncbi:MAG: glycosyltransferase family 39 protein, partial [bacterium]|nr:glycosyltransferase family 39 protein [bacterium]
EVYKEPTRGLFAALFYAIFSTTFLPQDMLAANIELLMVLPMTLCALFFLKEQFFIAGLFLGLSILTKYQGGILLPALALYLFWKNKNVTPAKAGVQPLTVLDSGFRRNDKGLFKGTLLPFFSLLLGAAWVGAGWVYYLYHNGALPDAIRCFLYIMDYAKGPPGTDIPYITLKFLLRTAMLAGAGFGLWYFAFRAMRQSLRHPSFLFTLWVLFGFAAVIAGGRMYFHYYIILYPALSLLAGDWAGHFFERLKGMPFEKGAWRLTLFVVMIFIPVTGFTAYATYKPFRPKHKDYWIYVVDYIQDRTGPADSIFVWGYCPQIYTVADRRPATRFTTADYLTGRSPKTAGLEYDPRTANPPSVWKKLRRDFITPQEVIDYDTSENIFPGAWNLLMEDFQKNPPELIVDTSPSNYRMYGRYPMHEFPDLQEYVK